MLPAVVAVSTVPSITRGWVLLLGRWCEPRQELRMSGFPEAKSLC